MQRERSDFKETDAHLNYRQQNLVETSICKEMFAKQSFCRLMFAERMGDLSAQLIVCRTMWVGWQSANRLHFRGSQLKELRD